MPAVKKNYCHLSFRVSENVRDALRHHAQRLGADMNDIVRQATIALIEELDEKEARARERKRAAHPQAVGLGGRGAVGLGNRRKRTPEPEPVAPEKIERSFRRYAEYLEQAGSKIDAELRSQTIIEDVNERVSSKKEANAALKAFHEFMRARTEAKMVLTPKKDVLDVGSVTVDGDVDDG